MRNNSTEGQVPSTSSSSNTQQTPKAGLYLLLMKVGPKLLSIFPKLLKSTKAVKVGMGAATAASYSVLFTWQFAVALMVMIGWHEYGHIVAMRQQGMKTKGFFFLPLLGGVAVGTSDYPDRKGQAIVAIMGPIFGLALSAAALGAFYVTKQPLWAAIAGWWSLINLFNLLPVLPLDGGKILSAIALSINSKVGLWVLTGSLVALFVVGLKVGAILFITLLAVGGIELYFEYKRQSETNRQVGIESKNQASILAPMKASENFWTFVSYLLVSALLWSIIELTAHVPDASIAKHLLS